MKATILSSVMTCLALAAPGFAADAPPPADPQPEPGKEAPAKAAETKPAAKDAAAKTETGNDESAKDDDSKPENPVQKHHDGSTKVANEQDELSADVQQLTLEQTVPKVIELFKQVEGIMDEATDWLAEYDTGGRTIAAQTEVVEKIFEATKERQKQQGGSQAGGAMMDMMEQMMEEGDGKDGKEKGKKPGNQPGQGMTGNSDSANEGSAGTGEAKSETRRVPKAAGTAGAPLPEEFRKAIDAYNRGLQQTGK